MSQENMKVVRRAVAAFNARNRKELLGLMDPEIEYESPMEQRTYRGLDGMLQYRDDVDAVLEEFHTEDDRFLEVGEDRVLHLYRIVGRGVGSGVPVARQNAILWQLRDGRLFRGRAYLDQREALEAAGLSE
jgi:ketosteroid isomerase-like protein